MKATLTWAPPTQLDGTVVITVGATQDPPLGAVVPAGKVVVGVGDDVVVVRKVDVELGLVVPELKLQEMPAPPLTENMYVEGTKHPPAV